MNKLTRSVFSIAISLALLGGTGAAYGAVNVQWTLQHTGGCGLDAKLHRVNAAGLPLPAVIRRTIIRDHEFEIAGRLRFVHA